MRSGEGWSPWLEPPPPPARRFWNLFINPYENLWLARAARIEEFASDLGELAQQHEARPQTLASYAWVESLVRAELALTSSPSRQFQFGVAVDEDAPTWISPALQGMAQAEDDAHSV